MMIKSPKAIQKLPFFRQRQPTLPELENLLDLYPQAALLLDMQLNRVLLANAGATELTAFTRVELTSQPLDLLLPTLDEIYSSGNCNDATRLVSTLLTRNGPTIEVILNLHRLDPSGIWIFATLEHTTRSQQQEADRLRQSHRLEDLHEMALATQEPEVEAAIREVLKVSQRMTGAEIMLVYLISPTSPEIIRVASVVMTPAEGNTQNNNEAASLASLFPEALPLTEIRSVTISGIWIPGKRPQNALQRIARVANLAYLASMPLGEPNAFNGLVIAADTCAPPADQILGLLQILTDAINNYLVRSSTFSNTQTAQQKLEAELTIKRLALESVQEGVIVVASDLTVVEMNSNAEWTLGYASREVKGEPVENVVIGIDTLIPALQAANSGISTPNLGNVHIHRRDGTAFPAHVSTLPAILNNQLLGVIIVFRDLSEHEQFQVRNQQLEQRALLGEVTAIFAHEVRNPINNISTGLQWMALNLAKDDPNQELVARLEQDCNRLDQLMKSVLTFSRPAENKNEVIDLKILIERLFERWRPRMARVNVIHRLSVTTPKPFVSGDGRALEQVFSNLMSNSVEAMTSTGGTLAINIRSVTAPAERNLVEITVADDGPGIPSDIIEHIFDPFFTTNRFGTGLGLAIANRIVTAHKGTIHVESVPGGTVFQVMLPAAE